MLVWMLTPLPQNKTSRKGSQNVNKIRLVEEGDIIDPEFNSFFKTEN